ncbi:MAG: ABC transporter permease [Thermoplasmatota archaeon]
MDGDRKKAIISLAKKEFMDNVRNKWIIIVSILFIALILLISAYGSMSKGSGIKGYKFTLSFAPSIVVTFISIIALMMGYKTLINEIESKSIGILLSSELSRVDVVVGKFLGLASVLTTSILVGLGIGGIVIGISSGFQNIVMYGKFMFLSILFSLTYVSIAMAMSSFVNKTSRALAGGIFIWILFNVLWDLITVGILAVTEGIPTSQDLTFPDWYSYLNSMNPNSSLGMAVNKIAGGTTYPELLNIWVLMGILVVWIVVPIIVTFVIFGKRDL